MLLSQSLFSSYSPHSLPRNQPMLNCKIPLLIDNPLYFGTVVRKTFIVRHTKLNLQLQDKGVSGGEIKENR